MFQPNDLAMSIKDLVVTERRIDSLFGTTRVGVESGEEAFLKAAKFDVENSA